jgi:hypothetical protein
MQVVAWHDWLDRHIPYYERQKHQDRYRDNPPACILVINPVDRNRLAGVNGFTNWEAMENRINDLGYRAEPVFQDTDTHQRWYWAFWNHHEALVAVIRLS